MKAPYTRCSFPVLALFYFTCLFFFHSAQAQFDLKDPNMVYKDKDGKPMTMDSVMSFVSKGAFSMQKKDLGNGKTEVTLFRQSNEAVEKQIKAHKEWIAKWIGKPFPEFALSDFSGNLIKPSDLKGKAMVVNFWFTGCQPCIAEIPKLNKLVSSHEGQAIKFLAFSFNDKEVLEKSVRKHDFKYTQLSNAQKLIDELGINTYPTHMIIDKTGVIREIEIGANENIDKRLETLIEKTVGQ